MHVEMVKAKTEDRRYHNPKMLVNRYKKKTLTATTLTPAVRNLIKVRGGKIFRIKFFMKFLIIISP